MNYVILGNYGATNIGDEAILAAIIDSIREKDKEAAITVMSYDHRMTEVMHEVKSVPLFPAGFRSLYRGIFRGGIRQTVKALREANQIIFGGGGLFVDDCWRAAWLWFWQIFWAHFFCSNIIFYRQTVGPLNTKIGRYLTKKACSYCQEIIVRDKESKSLLQYLGVCHVQQAPDPVLEWKFVKRLVKNYYEKAYARERRGDSVSEDENPKTKRGSDKNKSYIVLSLRPWHLKKAGFFDYVTDALADYCHNFDYEIRFLPFQVRIDDDRKCWRIVKNNLADKVELRLHRFNYALPFKQELERLLAVFLNSERVVAMRLHALIFSYLCNLETVGIVYSNKVQSFVDYAGFRSVTTRTVDGLRDLL